MSKVSVGGQSYDTKSDVTVEKVGDTVYYSGTVESQDSALLLAAGFESSVKKVIATRMWGKPQDFYFYRDGNEKKLISKSSWDGADYIDLLLPVGNKVVNVEFTDNAKKYRLDLNGVK